MDAAVEWFAMSLPTSSWLMTPIGTFVRGKLDTALEDKKYSALLGSVLINMVQMITDDSELPLSSGNIESDDISIQSCQDTF